MNKYLTILILIILITGCSAIDSDYFTLNKTHKISHEQSKLILGKDYQREAVINNNVWTTQSSNAANNKNINDYARGIMQDLLSNLQYVSKSTPVAVADFVQLDSDYQSSPLIGKQLSQAFMHEVHKLGIPVVDYKLTDYIRVTDKGALALSKDFLELSGNIPIRYILTGTLLNDGDSIIVNARIVGTSSKAIVASAQGILPDTAIKDIWSVNLNDGIY